MPNDLDDFVFEADTHTYSDHNGIVRVGVTEGLKRCQIFDYSMVDPALLEFKRNLGQNVHGWTAEVDRHGLGSVDPTSLTPLEHGFGLGWLNFCASARPKFLEIEKPLLRTVGDVVIAGTMDRIALIGRRLWVLDIKCSSMMHPGWGLQLADYEMLYTGRPHVGHMGRMIVRLLGDGRFRTASFMDPIDGVVALAAGRWVANPADEASYITVSNWRKNMRIYRDDS